MRDRQGRFVTIEFKALTIENRRQLFALNRYTLPVAGQSTNPVFLIVPFMPRRVPLSGSGCSAVGAT